MRNIFILSTIFILFCISLPGITKAENLDDVVNRLQKKYEGINDFHSDFVQEADVKALGKVQKAYGEVWFKKPGKMRWNYYSPSKDTVVSDGNKLWYYSEQENQVLESTLADISGDTSSTTLLSGLGKIKELFDVKFVSDKGLKDSKGYLLQLIPKDLDEEELQNTVIINVNKSDSLVSTIYLFDPFGNQTKISLLKTEINKKISDKLFKFKSPKGAEVVKLPAQR